MVVVVAVMVVKEQCNLVSGGLTMLMMMGLVGLVLVEAEFEIELELYIF